MCESKSDEPQERIITIVMQKAIAITAIISFVLGVIVSGKLMADFKDRKAEQLAAEVARVQLAQKEEVRRIEQDSAKRLAEALAERDKALAMASADHARADQLRKQSSQLSAKLERLSAAPADPSDANAERAASCERLLAEASGLLAEGAELAAEGGQLAAKLSANKDALSKILKN